MIFYGEKLLIELSFLIGLCSILQLLTFNSLLQFGLKFILHVRQNENCVPVYNATT